ncbi:MAG: hypothetical protein KUG81_04105, partial [Gammaproteobacteria bacterium]|nr:hypothetical protein [Gammaproteobacteria bacterium]
TKITEIKLNIVKDVIKSRKESSEKRENAILTAQKNARIKDLIAQKKDGALEDLSVEELEKMLED